MRSLIPSLTRGALLAATGGRATAFDCLSCAKGIYQMHGAQRPVCTCCGEPAPDSIWRLMRDALVNSSTAA